MSRRRREAAGAVRVRHRSAGIDRRAAAGTDYRRGHRTRPSRLLRQAGDVRRAAEASQTRVHQTTWTWRSASLRRLSPRRLPPAAGVPPRASRLSPCRWCRRLRSPARGMRRRTRGTRTIRRSEKPGAPQDPLALAVAAGAQWRPAHSWRPGLSRSIAPELCAVVE